MDFVHDITAIPLTDHEIATALKNYRTAPLGMEDNQADFRVSIAGAQEKAAFLWKDGQWCRPQGYLQ